MNAAPLSKVYQIPHPLPLDSGQALEAALNRVRESGELLAIFKQHGLTLTAP